jgi:transposase
MRSERVFLLPIEGSGGKDMIKADVLHEIHPRFKFRETKKEIARALGLDVRTIRKLLRQEAPQPYERELKGNRLLAGSEERIKRRVAAVGYCAMSIYEELRADGFRGGYDVVRRFVGPLREEATVEATMRFETPPGQQGQADWGQCWTMIAGRRARVHLFVKIIQFLGCPLLRSSRNDR